MQCKENNQDTILVQFCLGFQLPDKHSFAFKDSI